MQVTFTHRAPGAVFAPNAFDSSIGREIDVHLPDSPQATKGRLVAAEVAVDGSAVSLTVELPDGIITFPSMTDLAGLSSFPFHEATLARVRHDGPDATLS